MYFRYTNLTIEHLEFLDMIADSQGFVKQNVARSSELVEYDSLLVNPMALDSFEKMQKVGFLLDLNLCIVSAYRDLDEQVECFFRGTCPKGSVYNPIQNFFGLGDLCEVKKDYLARSRWVAPPGYSEHHTGLALDFCSQSLEFANTQEYQWLLDNAANFGFIQSYPEFNTTQKGCSYEPWHWLYIGV